MGGIPSLVDNGGTRSVLPLGRHSATLEEIEECFVPEGDVNRREIFNRFLSVFYASKEVFGSVCSVWIGGSFVTSEPTPHDMDVVFLIRPEDYDRARESERGKFFLDRLGTKHGFGAAVDAFFFVVEPFDAEADPRVDVEFCRYLTTRGYWDQLWSLSRFADPSDQRAFLPSAGYLEVVVDGFVR